MAVAGYAWRYAVPQGLPVQLISVSLDGSGSMRLALYCTAKLAGTVDIGVVRWQWRHTPGVILYRKACRR